MAVPVKAAIPKKKVPNLAFLSAEFPSSPSVKISLEKKVTPLIPVVWWKIDNIIHTDKAFL